MSRYLFIQSQNPFTDVRANAHFDLACRLVAAGNQVNLLLVESGVSVSRRGAVCDTFDALRTQGIKLLADSFSLRQREIDAEQLKDAIAIVNVGVVIQSMVDGDKVFWN